MVGGPLRVRALAAVRHRPQRRNRADVVVPAFDAPRGDGGVVHGPAEGEIGLRVPLQAAELRPRAAKAPAQRGVVVHFVQDREPVAGRRLGIRPVGPELRQHAGVVAARHHLGRVRFAGDRVDVVAAAGVAALPGVEECWIVGEVRRVALDVADAGRGDVHGRAVVGRQVGGPNGNQRERPLVVVGKRAVDGRRRAGVVPHRVGEAVALVAHAVVGRQRERRHRAPLRA